MLREEIEFESIPVGPLGIIPLKSCVEMGNKIDYYITTWRKNRESELKGTIAFSGYEKDKLLHRADSQAEPAAADVRGIHVAADEVQVEGERRIEERTTPVAAVLAPVTEGRPVAAA